MRPTAIAILLCACAAAWSAQGEGRLADKAAACRRSPLLAGKCYVVRGELAPADGQGGLHILSIGADRDLKVVDARDQDGEEADLLPRSVDAAISRQGVDADTIASFTVCPLTAARTGWVQHVCVADAARVKAHNPDDEPPAAPHSKPPRAKGPTD